MKLRNKKTGEIIENIWWDVEADKLCIDGDKLYFYNSLAELNEEWEDCEDKYYGITHFGQVREIDNEYEKMREDMEQIGNYFETKEEAEKAVEKLKAWKRLKDKGFRFERWLLGMSTLTLTFSDYIESDDETRTDLDLLFGGEK